MSEMPSLGLSSSHLGRDLLLLPPKSNIVSVTMVIHSPSPILIFVVCESVILSIKTVTTNLFCEIVQQTHCIGKVIFDKILYNKSIPNKYLEKPTAEQLTGQPRGHMYLLCVCLLPDTDNFIVHNNNHLYIDIFTSQFRIMNYSFIRIEKLTFPTVVAAILNSPTSYGWHRRDKSRSDYSEKCLVVIISLFN